MKSRDKRTPRRSTLALEIYSSSASAKSHKFRHHNFALTPKFSSFVNSKYPERVAACLGLTKFKRNKRSKLTKLIARSNGGGFSSDLARDKIKAGARVASFQDRPRRPNFELRSRQLLHNQCAKALGALVLRPRAIKLSFMSSH